MAINNSYLVDFNKPYVAAKQIDYVLEAIKSDHISGDGYFTKKCHLILENILGCKKALLTTSCTHALEMCAILLDINQGDEVILPSFTFVSTANAFILRGAKPVFVDIRPDTLNIDEKKIEKVITERTKAIVVVHYAGVGCEMNAIMQISKRNHIPVVEDNAHGLFGKYNGSYLGAIGCLAAQSFHETKNISCGEGGAILINNPEYVEKAEIIREKGTNRSRFFRGQVDKYTWVDKGSSYLPSDILAAALFSQLTEADLIQEKRKNIWQRYFSGLEKWARQKDIELPTIPENCDQSFHMFYLLLPGLHERDRFIGYLKQHAINSVFHYVPLHSSPMGESYGYKSGDFPVTESTSNRLVRLPFYTDLSVKNQNFVIKTICNFK